MYWSLAHSVSCNSVLLLPAVPAPVTLPNALPLGGAVLSSSSRSSRACILSWRSSLSLSLSANWKRTWCDADSFVRHGNCPQTKKNSKDPYSQYLQDFLQLFPLHNQPLQMCGLLHATLKKNDCTGASFLIILWPWVKVKTFHTGAKCRA